MSDWAPHATVACVIEQDGRYLLVEERDKSSGIMVFNQPAGHLEPGESLTEGALRETLEETGWIVELQHLVGVYQYHSKHNDLVYLRFAFAAGPVEQKQIAIDPDISAVHWLTKEEIKDWIPRSPMVRQCILDAEEIGPVALDFIQQLE